MAHTVVGFFDNAAEAQDAIVKLTKYGIDRERIDISNNNSSGDSSYRTSDSDRYRTSDSGYGTSNTGTFGTSDNDRYRTDDNDSRVSYDRDNDRDRHHDHENGITRFFKNLFGDDDNDADKYSRVASRAASIVTVHANSSDEAEQAADILDDCGAVDVDERAARYGNSGSNESTSRNYVGNTATDRSDRDYSDRNKTEKLDVIREDIEIGKREVERGGVRLRSRIVEKPVEETVRLREEHVTVNRNPVYRATRDGDISNFQERDIEMIERAEVPVVKKESRVVEEVSLNKEVEEREETIRDTVRNTEVDIENIDRNSNSERNLGADTDLGNRNRNASDDRRSSDRLSDDLTERGI